ncbi:MAG: D-2-hydroxyacid dehydrogenase family protein [Proteobacteria bacterium]|nr:D-2-hydroxyacid dehydrogenase family protein [Pseudomonadota bacterium]
MPVAIVVPDDCPVALAGTPAEARLRRLGAVTIHADRLAGSESELLDRLRNADVALLLKGATPLPSTVLEACTRLRLISRWGTGIESIDLTSCRRRGIAVAYTPNNDSDEIAEHAIALMLAVMRRIPEMDRAIRVGQWPGDAILTPRGRTLGVIGLGAIGSRTARLGKALGMTILSWSYSADRGRAAELGATAVSLEELLRRSDVVSLHIRGSDATRNLLDQARFATMKPGAFLINTARASLVDKAALLEALANGRLAGAGLDVFHREPIPAGDPLLGFPNVVLTPHNGGLMADVIARGLNRAIDNIENYLAGRPAELVLDPKL